MDSLGSRPILTPARAPLSETDGNTPLRKRARVEAKLGALTPPTPSADRDKPEQ